MFWFAEHVRLDTMARWKDQRPSVVPEGWLSDLESTDKHIDWFLSFSGGVRHCLLIAWELENAGHFYGRPTPLLFRMALGTLWVICEIGGLLFVYCYESSAFQLARPGVTLSQLADSVVSHNPQADEVSYDRTQLVLGDWFHSSADQEFREGKGKHHRRRELHARGGRVGDKWMLDS